MNLGPHFVVLNKIAAIGSRQSQIDSLNKTAVVLKVTAQDLLRQFVGLQPQLRRDLRELLFLCGLKSHFHAHSLERFMGAVKHHIS